MPLSVDNDDLVLVTEDNVPFVMFCFDLALREGVLDQATRDVVVPIVEGRHWPHFRGKAGKKVVRAVIPLLAPGCVLQLFRASKVVLPRYEWAHLYDALGVPMPMRGTNRELGEWFDLLLNVCVFGEATVMGPMPVYFQRQWDKDALYPLLREMEHLRETTIRLFVAKSVPQAVVRDAFCIPPDALLEIFVDSPRELPDRVLDPIAGQA